MDKNYLLLFLVFWPFVGAVISYLVGRKDKNARNLIAIGVTAVEFLVVASLYRPDLNEVPIEAVIEGFAGVGLYLKMDGFRFVYALICSFMWLMTTILSKEYFAHYRNRNRYYMFMLMTLAATLGVLISNDFYTTFIFFEIMSFTSYVMVVHDEGEKTMKAAGTYMAVAVFIGLVLLMGIFLIDYNLGTTNFDQLREAYLGFAGNPNLIYLAAVLMMVGFGGKAGMFPLHIWLPQAHPVAPAPASALLSGVLTKTGIFGALIISSRMFLHDSTWGMFMLIIGVITMLVGAVLAVFSIDLKRTLACSSVSQIGFITVGIAMQCLLADHNALAVRGTMLYMINHSLIKLILFQVAGVIYMNLHELNLNKIRGFGKYKPLLNVLFLLGALSIIGVPGFSGFVSKTLVHESVVEYIWLFETYTPMAQFFRVIESLFTLSGGFTGAYMIKLYVALFIEDNPYTQKEHNAFNKKYMSKLSAIAILIPALLMPILGIRTDIMDAIATFGQELMHGHDPAHVVNYFAWINVRGVVASVSISIIVYFFVIRTFLMRKDENGNLEYVDGWPAWWSIEEKVYRPLLMNVLPFFGALFSRVIATVPGLFINLFTDRFKGLFVYLTEGKSQISENIVTPWDKEKEETIFTKLYTSSLRVGLLQYMLGVTFVIVVVVVFKTLA